MNLRIGSLCSGYGGLDLAVMDALGGHVIWHAQYEPPDKNGKPDVHQWPSRILEHRFPGVPNHGDITAIDWAAVEPVDILTAGWPCQDMSWAGLGAGIVNGARSSIWTHVARAIGELQPSLVVLENVRALLSGGEWVDEPADRCVCGWPRGWGGLHRDQHEEGVLRSPARRRDDGQGDGNPEDAPEGVRRLDLPVASSDREVGRSPLLEHDGQGCGTGVAQAGAAATPEGRTGSDRDQAGGSEGRAQGDSGREGGLERLPDASSGEAEEADSRTEPEGSFDPFTGEPISVCPSCGRDLGDGPTRHVFRSWMGVVLQDLARLGFDAQWTCIPASDVGAPHQRWRTFILAWPARSQGEHGSANAAPGRTGSRAFVLAWPADAPRPRLEARREGRPGGGAASDADGNALWQQPIAVAGCDRQAIAGLVGVGTPADAARDGRHQGRPESAGIERRPDAALGGGHAAADADEVGRERGRRPRSGGGRPQDHDQRADVDWGPYTAAVRRWERLTDRPAPAPTEKGKNGSRLAPVLPEWMMGLPAGWVTAVPGIPRNAQLHALGNGVVRQQGAVAIRILAERVGLSP